MFRISDIEFVTVYVNETATDRTPTLSRKQVHPTFDFVEYICKSFEASFEADLQCSRF